MLNLEILIEQKKMLEANISWLSYFNSNDEKIGKWEKELKEVLLKIKNNAK